MTIYEAILYGPFFAVCAGLIHEATDFVPVDLKPATHRNVRVIVSVIGATFMVWSVGNLTESRDETWAGSPYEDTETAAYPYGG